MGADWTECSLSKTLGPQSHDTCATITWQIIERILPIDGSLQCSHIGVHAARGAARTLAAGIYRDLQKTTHNLESTGMSHESASTLDNKNLCPLKS